MGYPPQDPYGYGQPGPYGGQGNGGQHYGPPGPYGWGPPPPPPNNAPALAALIANCLLTVFCCGVLAIPGIITAAVALNRVHTDPVSAKNLTTWSWVIFGVSIVLTLAALAALIALGVFAESVDEPYETYDALGTA